MKSMFLKKVSAVALAAVLAVSGLMATTVDVSAANTPANKPVESKKPTNGSTIKDTKNGYVYTFSVDSKGKITASFSAKATKNTKVTVPSTVVAKDGKKYTVNKLAKDAFKGNTKVTQITVPTSVTSIGANAFNGCTKLKTLTFNYTKYSKSNVTAKAFSGMKTSTTIKVPKKQLTSYKTLFRSKGLSKKNPVKAK